MVTGSSNKYCTKNTIEAFCLRCPLYPDSIHLLFYFCFVLFYLFCGSPGSAQDLILTLHSLYTPHSTLTTGLAIRDYRDAEDGFYIICKTSRLPSVLLLQTFSIISFLLCFYFCFPATSGNFLALCSWVTISGSGRTIWEAGDPTPVHYMQGKHHTHFLIFLPLFLIFKESLFQSRWSEAVTQ